MIKGSGGAGPLSPPGCVPAEPALGTSLFGNTCVPSVLQLQLWDCKSLVTWLWLCLSLPLGLSNPFPGLGANWG